MELTDECLFAVFLETKIYKIKELFSPKVKLFELYGWICFGRKSIVLSEAITSISFTKLTSVNYLRNLTKFDMK